MTGFFSFKRVFTAACIGMLMFGVVIITLGSILPSLVEKFQLNQVDAGTLTSLLPFGILIGSLLFGPIVDRYSYKYLLIICGIIIITALEGIAFTENIYLLQVSLLFIGIGGGAINGGTNALVADISTKSPTQRSANLSFLGIFFGVGALGMPLLLGVLSGYFVYHQIISCFGLLLLLPVIFFASTRFPQAKQSHRVPFGKSFKILKDIHLVLLGLFLFFQSGVEGIINNWSTLFLITESNFIQDSALYALSTFVFSLTLTRIVLTFLLNRVRPYQVLIVSIITAILGTLLIFTANGEVFGLSLLGIGLAAGFPVILSYVGALYPDLSGTAFGLVLVIGLAGNILLNFLMGVISNSHGVVVYPILLLICTICMGIILTITLKRLASKTYI